MVSAQRVASALTSPCASLMRSPASNSTSEALRGGPGRKAFCSSAHAHDFGRGQVSPSCTRSRQNCSSGTTRHGRHGLVLLAGEEDQARRSHKGKSFEGNKRRRGRPAYLRSPFDSPLRDGNRDRLIGLLTERAVKTLMCYLMETNMNVYHWLLSFYKENPIPKIGSWGDISGETFLRKLLSSPIQHAKASLGRDALYDCALGCGVDPRNIAQRIMEIRSQLAQEFAQDLQAISEENSLLLRETLHSSLNNLLNAPPMPSEDGFVHPEM